MNSSATAKTENSGNVLQFTQPATFQSSARGVQPPRIASLPPVDQESRYQAISAKYGSPAYRRGQDLKDAVCYNCQKKRHLASKCTESRPPPDNTKSNSPCWPCRQCPTWFQVQVCCCRRSSQRTRTDQCISRQRFKCHHC